MTGEPVALSFRQADAVGFQFRALFFAVQWRAKT
jgi:hypothetical protein